MWNVRPEKVVARLDMARHPLTIISSGPGAAARLFGFCDDLLDLVERSFPDHHPEGAINPNFLLRAWSCGLVAGHIRRGLRFSFPERVARRMSTSA